MSELSIVYMGLCGWFISVIHLFLIETLLIVPLLVCSSFVGEFFAKFRMPYILVVITVLIILRVNVVLI